MAGVPTSQDYQTERSIFRGGERGCDGSHSRAARQALAMRGFQAGELAGNRQGIQFRCRTSVPICSFNRYDNFILSNHTEASSRRVFDNSWIFTQLVNF